VGIAQFSCSNLFRTVFSRPHDRVCRSVRIASSPERRRKEGSSCPKIPSRGRVPSLCLTKCFTSFVSYVRSTT